jgi:lipopolysaccharide export system protein LptC
MAPASDRKNAPPGGNSVANGWSSHPHRTTVRNALRYSRFVALMRRALPAAAVMILGLVVAYALLPRNSDRVSLGYRSVGGVKDDLTMKKPRLSGVDAKGNPYLITADSAVQEGRNAHRAALTNVDADLQYGGDKWASVNAGKGVVDLDAKHLRLSGGIALFTDAGYELHTASAFADLGRNTIRGDEKVKGQGPLGTLSADSFFVDRDSGHVTLRGNVHMRMYPGKVKR